MTANAKQKARHMSYCYRTSARSEAAIKTEYVCTIIHSEHIHPFRCVALVLGTALPPSRNWFARLVSAN